MICYFLSIAGFVILSLLMLVVFACDVLRMVSKSSLSEHARELRDYIHSSGFSSVSRSGVTGSPSRLRLRRSFTHLGLARPWLLERIQMLPLLKTRMNLLSHIGSSTYSAATMKVSNKKENLDRRQRQDLRRFAMISHSTLHLQGKQHLWNVLCLYVSE